MKENWTKIAFFVGMLVLQIGLAFILVKYILPPKNIAMSEELARPNKEDSNLKPVSQTKESSKQDQTKSLEEIEPDSIIDSNVMNDISVFIEEDMNEEDLKDSYSFVLDELVINPAETRGSKFIIISLTVIAKGKEIEKKVELNMPAIRDAINTLIARKTVVWLSNIDNRPFLREDIKLLLESILKDSKVLRVYFTKYLFQ